jgi:hypothetical protein
MEMQRGEILNEKPQSLIGILTNAFIETAG